MVNIMTAGKRHLQKTSWYFLFLQLLWVQLTLSAQTGTAANAANMVKEEKEKFLRNLKASSNDSAIVYPLARYVDLQVNSIARSWGKEAKLPAAEREKAARSLIYFLRELNSNIARQKSAIYDIPGALQSYKSILTALLNHKPLAELLVPMNPGYSQLMAASFSQYKEYALLDDIAVYKRVASSPEFILQFLENKPGFRYADSLLLYAAADDPWKMVFYLNKDKPVVQDGLRNAGNIYMQQIVALSKDKQSSELLPFVTQLAENKITTEEILAKRTEVVGYFQLLVNTLKATANSQDSLSIFLKPLRRAIKQKSLAFFVNPVNEQHNAAAALRFAPVKNLRPEDIYYIITTSGEDLYTSSYLGLYKRMMEQLKGHPADSIFDIVQYDNFHQFFRLAANYNVLADFLENIPREKIKGLLKRFIEGIESDTNKGLDRAMDIADSFSPLASAPEIFELMESELQINLNRCTAANQFLGIRLYGILLEVYELVKQKVPPEKLWANLGNYELLKKTALENVNGRIVQLVLFYGDEDGIASFNNFLKLYTDGSKWEISKNANWVSIRSVPDSSLILYANLPLDISQEMDVKAQDSLIAYLNSQSLEPVILIHRGHSYHLDKTLKRLTPSVKLAILGSCGGYNKAISIASINPDVQVIGSKKTGSKSINDPIIEEINETLLGKKDLNWPGIWKKLTDRFSKDELTLGLFNEYFPPNNNMGLFVLKLFNFYNRFI